MVIGFCGSGSMAAAMARGWDGAVEGMLFTDSGSGRRGELAAELGGEAVNTNGELAARADLVVLAVKPAMLEEVAAELAGARAVVSLLGATPLERSRPLFRARRVPVMPNVAVEVRSAASSASPVEAARDPRRCSTCSATSSTSPMPPSTPRPP